MCRLGGREERGGVGERGTGVALRWWGGWVGIVLMSRGVKFALRNVLWVRWGGSCVVYCGWREECAVCGRLDGSYWRRIGRWESSEIG